MRAIAIELVDQVLGDERGHLDGLVGLADRTKRVEIEFVDVAKSRITGCLLQVGIEMAAVLTRHGITVDDAERRIAADAAGGGWDATLGTAAALEHEAAVPVGRQLDLKSTDEAAIVDRTDVLVDSAGYDTTVR
jgi:hypothetical protein